MALCSVKQHSAGCLQGQHSQGHLEAAGNGVAGGGGALPVLRCQLRHVRRQEGAKVRQVRLQGGQLAAVMEVGPKASCAGTAARHVATRCE